MHYIYNILHQEPRKRRYDEQKDMNDGMKHKVNTSTILPFGRPPPKAKSKDKQPLGKVSLQHSGR
jgi:hypothetical protein